MRLGCVIAVHVLCWCSRPMVTECGSCHSRTRHRIMADTAPAWGLRQLLNNPDAKPLCQRCESSLPILEQAR
jgi:hypothetical protein